ncbi:probable cytochrome P450 28a5 [Uranotaenia lowii]|uniref:probable cytochrome P450 28a5 n=1 Tax=Uranotaenia lowii TaxID=190385 RepID=UPI00247A8DF3|nr:probable cytochrome P450 28a5 [Uranotaenia lowii]
MLLTTGLIVGALWAFYLYLTWNFDYWKKRGVPGPDPIPLVGTFKAFLLRNRSVMDEKFEIFKKYKSKFNFVGVFMYRSPQILITSPALAKDLLTKNFKNFHDNEFGQVTDKYLDPLFGRNPFVMNGEEWKTKRAEITPAFTTSRMKVMYSNVEGISNKMSQYIKDREGTPLEGKELAGRFTTDVVSSCIFSADAQSFANENAEIREMGRKLMDSSLIFVLKIMLLTVFPTLARIFQVGFITKPREKFFTKLMVDAIRHRESSGEKRADYLDHLLALRQTKNISEIDMAAHGVTFFLDGFETSSAAMALALYELGKKPEIQQRLREELLAATGEDGTISYEVLSELPYLEQVFSETLRLWPSVTFMSKVCVRPTELDLTPTQKVLIEPGVIAIISLYCIQRDPDVFEDSFEFNPDRFSAEKGGTNPYQVTGSYMPFGDGPRQCLGMRFGRMQVKRGIYEILTKFKVSVNPKTEDPLRIVSSPAVSLGLTGLWLDFKPIA